MDTRSKMRCALAVWTLNFELEPGTLLNTLNAAKDRMKLPISRRLCFAIPVLLFTATLPAAPAADVKLTGTIGPSGVKQALLLVREPATPGVQQSLTLGEGESAGSIEVLRI